MFTKYGDAKIDQIIKFDELTKEQKDKLEKTKIQEDKKEDKNKNN